MKRTWIGALMLGATALSAPALAEVATPSLSYGDPATIDPAATGTQVLKIYGENISSDNTGHPDWREYYHIFIRKIAPGGGAEPWTRCDRPVGCTMSGWNPFLLILQVDAGRWAHVEGGALEMRYYTGLDDVEGSDPARNLYGQPQSGWSNVFRWNVMTAPPPAPPPPVELIRKGNLQELRAVQVGQSSLPVKRPMQQTPGVVGPMPRPIPTPDPVIRRPPQVVPKAP
jgi:hypothetical protein